MTLYISFFRQKSNVTGGTSPCLFKNADKINFSKGNPQFSQQKPFDFFDKENFGSFLKILSTLINIIWFICGKMVLSHLGITFIFRILNRSKDEYERSLLSKIHNSAGSIF